MRHNILDRFNVPYQFQSTRLRKAWLKQCDKACSIYWFQSTYPRRMRQHRDVVRLSGLDVSIHTTTRVVTAIINKSHHKNQYIWYNLHIPLIKDSVISFSAPIWLVKIYPVLVRIYWEVSVRYWFVLVLPNDIWTKFLKSKRKFSNFLKNKKAPPENSGSAFFNESG